ncbi:MAG: sigma 54-interacting transcriptional regulator [Proteobacteria bacterium]|nr:sigma 54-interacting transcriptional regulator [Pseudomonadota bacterium]
MKLTQKKASLDKMHRFRKSLLELSAKLIGMQPYDIHQEIEKGLKLTQEFGMFDWIVLTGLSDDGKKATIIYSYTNQETDGSAATITDEDIQWIFPDFFNGRTFALAHLPDDLPQNEMAGRCFCANKGIKSALIVPLEACKPIRGILFLASNHDGSIWTDELVVEFRHLGGILAGAMERKKSADQIHELLRFEHLLSEISATYINLPTNNVEKVIRNDLGRLGQLLDVDRSVFYLLDEDKHSFRFDLPFVWVPEKENVTGKVIEERMQSDPNFFEDLQYVFEKWSKGEPLQLTTLDELPKEAERVRQFYLRIGVKSILSIPVSVACSTVGALVLTTTKKHRTWSQDLIPRLRLFGEIFANALIRKQSEEKLQNALSEIRKLKERFEADYTYLREEINLGHDFSDIVGKSAALKQILVKVKQVAPTYATVLLLGETGTGKGLIARAIHNASKIKDRPLIQVNCASLTPSLIESELFGHEKGAFTGAQSRRLGRFELANGTTLFLDEIGELPFELQAKLLRVLQDGEFERVGGSITIKTDVRVIAATNRDLEKEVEAGRFREDLWYRLSIFPIYVPPLRERVEDIPLFVRWFADKHGKRIGKQFDAISMKTIKELQNYSWPGNIRELENVIERAVITSSGGNLHIEIPLRFSGKSPNKEQQLEKYKREINKALKDTNWKIEGPTGAARCLGLKASTLRYWMKKLGIQRPII